jgi:hypothetical protein
MGGDCTDARYVGEVNAYNPINLTPKIERRLISLFLVGLAFCTLRHLRFSICSRR